MKLTFNLFPLLPLKVFLNFGNSSYFSCENLYFNHTAEVEAGMHFDCDQPFCGAEVPVDMVFWISDFSIHKHV